MINNELIEKYFSNRLTDKDLELFNELYENDSEFRTEVDFLKDVKRVSEKEDDANFKKKLMAFEGIKINKAKKWLIPITTAAAIALIALSVTIFKQTTLNEDELFATYFQPSKNVSAPIIRSQNTETEINNAYIAYSESNYLEAVSLFEKSFKEINKPELLYYEGNALLALGNYNEAIEKFKQHISFNDALSNRSHWYLALAYIKTKQLENARKELKTFITSKETYKKSEAVLLLKKLK